MKIHLALLGLLLPAPAFAHFGMVLPAAPMVTQQDGREIGVTFAFLHPFEGIGMSLEPPQVSVHFGGTATDISQSLAATELYGADAFTAQVPLSRPGVYAISMTPQPYWEPAEDVFIVHYTKTYVAAFGDDSGWDAELGLPTEIVPLSRPFGLWQGNVFQGIVKIGGQPAPYAEVEVEYYNTTGAETPPEMMITQTVKADGNGVFTYAPPASGWWGFAALSTADQTMTREGAEKEVEMGAVLWVHFEAWK